MEYELKKYGAECAVFFDEMEPHSLGELRGSLFIMEVFLIRKRVSSFVGFIIIRFCVSHVVEL